MSVKALGALYYRRSLYGSKSTSSTLYFYGKHEPCLISSPISELKIGRNHHALIKPEIREGISRIFDLFTPPDLEGPPPAIVGHQNEEATTRLIHLTPLDITGLVGLLCPANSSLSSPVPPAPTGFSSDRPSTAGSSTLVAGTSDTGNPAPMSVDQINPDDKTTMDDPARSHNITDNAGTDPAAKSSTETETCIKKPVEPSFEDSHRVLKRACQTFKDVITRNGGLRSESTLRNWHPFHYSLDGEIHSHSAPHDVLSMEDREASTTTAKVEVKLQAMEHNEPYRELKASIARLLLHHDLPQATLGSECQVEDTLELLIQGAADKAHLNLDFIQEHIWLMTGESYRDFKARSSDHSHQALLKEITQELHVKTSSAIKHCEQFEQDWRALQAIIDSQTIELSKLDEARRALRVKMWYISDVRHSAPYEEATLVTRALRSMTKMKAPKHTGSISSWARQRLRGPNIHDRAEAQALEAIIATKNHGGLAKLSDEQVEITGRWLTRRSIENFCKGEERIHRFCYEVQKSVGKIAGSGLLESPVLWSSNLFRQERNSYDLQRPRPGPIGVSHGSPGVPFGQPLHGGLPSSGLGSPTSMSRTSARVESLLPNSGMGATWHTNQGLNKTTGLGLYSGQPLLPPTPTSPPSTWPGTTLSPEVPLYATPPLPFSSRTSANHSRTSSEEETSSPILTFAESTRRSLYSLLISDLGYLLWSQGSETDLWIADFLQSNQSISNPQLSEAASQNDPDHIPSFPGINTVRQENSSSIGRGAGLQVLAPGMSPDKATNLAHKDGASSWFSEVYSTLLGKMSTKADPHLKLQLLHDIEIMICKRLSSQRKHYPLDPSSGPAHHQEINRSLRSRTVPRTKATSLEEVIANCTERRAGTLRVKYHQGEPLTKPPEAEAEVSVSPDTDDIVDAWLSIFRDPKLCPNTLFRDLQYIAAFVPSDTLDQTAQGKAFWDAGLAALALKEEVCEALIERASQITAYHILPRSSGDTVTDTNLATTTLGDAARLWQITAKEGSPVAARELALFYLTQPELLSRMTMPFSKAKDVYKSASTNDVRSGDRERGRLDPYTFAAVFHWMEVAANGGDKDAKDFLKDNGDLGRVR